MGNSVDEVDKFVGVCAVGVSALIIYYVGIWFLVALLVAWLEYLHGFLRKLWKMLRSEVFRNTGGIVGVPDIAIEHWRWQNGPTCSINAQRMILAIFNIQKSEDELSGRQQAFGKHSAKGSSSIDFILNGYGVKTKRIEKDKENLYPEIYWALRSGHLVIATVNSFSLNNPDELFHSEKNPISDHAIVITGLEAKNRSLFVCYSDSGVFDGSLKIIPYKQLLDSSDNYFIKTQKIPKDRRNKYKEIPQNKPISCLRCKKNMRIPFGRDIRVTCPKCNAVFLVEGGLSGDLT